MADRSPFEGRSYSEGDHQDETIELYETSRERERFDEQANLYAIIMATEHLERAYARDAIEPKEYTTQCKKLISQFKLAERILRNDTTTETFMQLYQMDCPRATERLLKMGVPEPLRGGSDEANHVVTVAEAGTTCFWSLRVLWPVRFVLCPLMEWNGSSLCSIFLYDQPLVLQSLRSLQPWIPCRWIKERLMSCSLCCQI